MNKKLLMKMKMPKNKIVGILLGLVILFAFWFLFLRGGKMEGLALPPKPLPQKKAVNLAAKKGSLPTTIHTVPPAMAGAVAGAKGGLLH